MSTTTREQELIEVRRKNLALARAALKRKRDAQKKVVTEYIDEEESERPRKKPKKRKKTIITEFSDVNEEEDSDFRDALYRIIANNHDQEKKTIEHSRSTTFSVFTDASKTILPVLGSTFVALMCYAIKEKIQRRLQEYMHNKSDSTNIADSNGANIIVGTSNSISGNNGSNKTNTSLNDKQKEIETSEIETSDLFK